MSLSSSGKKKSAIRGVWESAEPASVWLHAGLLLSLVCASQRNSSTRGITWVREISDNWGWSLTSVLVSSSRIKSSKRGTSVSRGLSANALSISGTRGLSRRLFNVRGLSLGPSNLSFAMGLISGWLSMSSKRGTSFRFGLSNDLGVSSALGLSCAVFNVCGLSCRLRGLCFAIGLISGWLRMSSNGGISLPGELCDVSRPPV